jgi:hypothetical protein
MACTTDLRPSLKDVYFSRSEFEDVATIAQAGLVQRKVPRTVQNENCGIWWVKILAPLRGLGRDVWRAGLMAFAFKIQFKDLR